MKAKIGYLLLVTIVTVAMVVFAGCKKKEPAPTPLKKEMFEQGKCYQIVNKVNRHQLVAGSGGLDPKDKNVWQYPTERNPVGYEWLLMPADGQCFWIINKNSGFGLFAKGEKQVIQDNVSATGVDPNGFLWEIERSGEGEYEIKSKIIKYGRRYLAAGSGGLDPTDLEVWCWPKDTNSGALGILWEITPMIDLPFDLKTQPGTEPHLIGDVDRIKGFGFAPKQQTDPVLIGEILIPFFCVNKENPSVQVRDDPYYKFKREGFWRRELYNENDGEQEKEETKKVKTGLVEVTSETIEDKTGITVNAEAGFSYSGFTASVSNSLSKELKVTRSTSMTKMVEEEIILTVKFPEGKRYAEAVWLRVDRYTLSDLNGNTKLIFETVDPEEKIEDSYPRKGS